MLRNFQDVLSNAAGYGRVKISVAVAQDKDVLQALKLAHDAGLSEPVLVGDAAAIRPLLSEVGLPTDTTVVDEPDINKAALAAVELVHNGTADVVMKGLVNTSDFLKALLNAGVGLRTGRLLSHLAAFEVPGESRLIFHSDGGMNIAPTLAEKKDIPSEIVYRRIDEEKVEGFVDFIIPERSAVAMKPLFEKKKKEKEDDE